MRRRILRGFDKCSTIIALCAARSWKVAVGISSAMFAPGYRDSTRPLLHSPHQPTVGASRLSKRKPDANAGLFRYSAVFNNKGLGASALLQTSDFRPNEAAAMAYLDRPSPATIARQDLEIERVLRLASLVVLLVDQKPHGPALLREPFLQHRRPGGRILMVGTTTEAQAHGSTSCGAAVGRTPIYSSPQAAAITSPSLHPSTQTHRACLTSGAYP